MDGTEYILHQDLTSPTDGNPACVTVKDAKGLYIDAASADVYIAYSKADLNNSTRRFNLKSTNGPHTINFTSPWSGTLYFAYVQAVMFARIAVGVF